MPDIRELLQAAKNKKVLFIYNNIFEINSIFKDNNFFSRIKYIEKVNDFYAVIQGQGCWLLAVSLQIQW